MKTMRIGAVAGVLAAAMVCGSAYAQEAAEVTVEGTRIVKTTIGRGALGAPINSLSLSYKVSYADLNLATEDGVSKLNERVKGAAKEACAEISRLYPQAQPDDAACARNAVKGAKDQVDAAIAAAKK